MTNAAPLRVGFNPDFAPFSYMENDRPSGLVIERIERALEDTNIEYNFIPKALSGLTQGLLDGEFDMLAAIAVTPERKEKYSFSKPILISGAAWFVPAYKEVLSNAIPKQIVTPRSGPLVEQIKSEFPGIKIHTSKDYDDALQIALYGKIDAAAALNWHVGKILVENKYRNLFHIPAKMFNKLPLAMAFKNGNSRELIKKVNEHIPDEWGK